MKGYLLDTSFLIDLMKQNPNALAVHSRIKGKERTSVLCAYELFKYSKTAAQLILKKDTIPFEKNDTFEAARIFRKLRRAGNIIPEIDIMIAGTAVSRGLILVTRDDHFKRVMGLNLESY